MRVDPATREDVAAIERIARESWSHDYPELLSSESLQEGVDEWYSERRIRDAVDWPDAYLLLARESTDEPVGFVHAVFEAEAQTGNLLRLYVHPDHRGDGYGTALLEAAHEALFDRGADRLRAMVLAANEIGNEFYRAFGFEHEGTETVYIGEEAYEENTYVFQPGDRTTDG